MSMTANKINLTAKQELFCQCILQGMSQYQAYLTAYDVEPTTGREVVDVHASELMNAGKIAVRIQELRDMAATHKVMTITRRKERLSELAESSDVAPRDVNNLIDTLNKMDHIYTTNVDSNVTIHISYDNSKSVESIDSPGIKELPSGIDTTGQEQTNPSEPNNQ